jgi:hypothetical protein
MTPNYAVDVADSSYTWYLTASKRSRRAYRQSEFALVVLSASVPLAAVLVPHNSALAAVLGSCLVILAGVRAIFHWQENYLRFSRAREAVDAERRLYRLSAPPYDDPTKRDHDLVKAVTKIEHDEMGRWANLADQRVIR